MPAHATMTSRERVLAALRHEEPDRVPMDLGGSLASTMVGRAYPALRAALGLPAQTTAEAWRYASVAEIDDEVRDALGVDLVHAPRAFGTGNLVKNISDTEFQDEWGVRWRRPPEGHYYVERAPFAGEATVAAVARHAWPTPAQIANVTGLADKLRALRKRTSRAITLELRGRVLSIGQFLRGFEDWMADLGDNHAFVEALLERTTALELAANELVLREVGDLVDIVYTSDDLGGQLGPLVSPACFKKLMRPHFARIWGQARQQTKAVLMHHCCGCATPFIRDFIDLGVQALNPIQVSASHMAPAQLKREYGRQMAFWGGVDTRDVMPRGTPADVRREVALRLHEMGRGGGYILAAVHNIQPEVPPANTIALFQAGRELGRYPLPATLG